TYFVVGKGKEPGVSKGIKLVNEKGSNRALGMYAGANLRFTLPGNMTVGDIDWFAVSCTNCTRPLVQGTIPKHIDVPVNLNTRWIKRKSRLGLLNIRGAPVNPEDFTNCETLYPDTIQVSWHLEADSITFYVRAVGAVNMWTAFGFSGADDKSQMPGADVAVISVLAKDNKVTVEDYYITDRVQCSGSAGVCPDIAQSGNDDLKVTSSGFDQGIVQAVYSRKLNTGDSKDKVIKSKGEMAVVAAQGPLNEEQPDTVLYHTMVVTRSTVKLDFGRAKAARNCVPLKATVQPVPGVTPKQLIGGRDMIGVSTFTAAIGPTGKDTIGYQAIVGMYGWGISWWINGELIPVIHVERGKTYTFIPHGGHNRISSAKYHPFYITDNHKGGGSKVKDPSSIGRPGHLLLAGVVLDPVAHAINTTAGEGRFCEYKKTPTSDQATTVDEFSKSVKLECEPTGPNVSFTWTPDEHTPDTVYYQCWTHYYLGWKIQEQQPVRSRWMFGTWAAWTPDCTASEGRSTRPLKTRWCSGTSATTYERQEPASSSVEEALRTGNGIFVKDDTGSYKRLKAYRNKTLVLKLTPGKKITDFKWFGVGALLAFKSRPTFICRGRGRWQRTWLANHANASAIVIEDENTLLVKNFYFDGSVPGTYFLVGKGNKPGPSKGMKIPDEKGSNSALRMYAGANLRLTLPENMTVDDIDWFAVSCTNCTRPLVQNTIPKHIDVPVTLNASWIRRKSQMGRLRIRGPPVNTDHFTNCETVYKDAIQVGWQLETDTITFHVRAVAALNTWTAFGLSGADDKSQMVHADVAVISIIPPNNKVVVADYFLTDRVQCTGSSGVCSDTAQSGTNDLTVKSSSFANGIVDVVYSRKLDTGDSKDKAINAQGPTAVVAAQGPLNEAQTDVVLYHTMIVTKDTVTLEFARAKAARNCPPLPGEPQPVPGGESPSKLLGGRHMVGVKAFDAALGPTGKADIGYQAITGMHGWGISCPKGGGLKVKDQSTIGKPGHILYAGVNFDNTTKRIDTTKGAGAFCEYKSTPATQTATAFEEFKKSVHFVCDSGDPVVFTWAPDKDTPDELYYQCYNHYYLGWKIMVHDKGKGPVVPPAPHPAPKPTPPKPTPPKPTPPTPKPSADKGAHSGGLCRSTCASAVLICLRNRRRHTSP
ncbi:hypothetical protein MTO96_027778, partial [Rhipicephalus appendiculatus]